MTYIDRRILTTTEEMELIKLGFKLFFKYSLEKDLNIFEIYVTQNSH